MVRLNLPSRRRAASKPAGVAGKLGLTLFFFFFFALGSLFEVFIVREFGRAVGQRSWKKVPCKIVTSEVQERDDSDEPFAFTVRYEYEYGGRTYTGTAYKRSYSGSEKYSQAQNLAQKYPTGLGTVCYVDAERPGRAILKRDSLLIGLLVFFPLIFVAIGAGGIYFIWRKQPPPEAKPIAAEAHGATGKSKYAMVAFFGIFAVAGGFMFYFLGVRPIARTIDAESWSETPCQILRGEVRSHDSDDGTTYSVYILYQYEFNGQTYKCDRYDFIGGSSSGYRGKARVVALYEAAAHPVCYVDPDNPSEAVLKRGFHAKLLLALFPLPFLLIGVGGIIHVLRSKEDATGAPGRSWMPRRRASTPADLSVLRPGTDGGPAVLEPKYSGAVKLLGAVLIAAFWNGIVSIFVFQVVDSFRHGHPDWFQTLFMLPFVVVGIGLLALVVYQLLAVFNPRPRLKLSSATIPLGGAAELQWSFAGRTNRIGQFTVTLRGIEEARYRRGTNTYTDKNTFYEMELYKTSSNAEITGGQVGFVLPPETMHSFEAENNKIIWNLDVHGDIRRWPDVKESFKITVTPAVA
jgi:hypothetical protein